MEKKDVLPRDAQSILELAARSMFDLFANASEGMLLVDRQGTLVRVVPDLGPVTDYRDDLVRLGG